VENSGVKIKVNNSTIATIVAGYNTLENPIPHIEISDAGLMTATIDCANYGTSFTVVPFLDSYCIDGIVDYTYTNHVDVEGTPVEVTMTTPTPTTPVDGDPCPGAATVTDHEGNVYNTVQIGTQCWTKTNMREVPANATDGTSSGASSNTEPYYYVNPDVDATVYGYYYNWPAANQVCPEGWHLPDSTEWKTMLVYVSTAKETNDSYKYRCGGDSTYIARALATDGDYWLRSSVSESYPCEPEYDLSQNNKTGFSAVPAGTWTPNNGFDRVGDIADFWISSMFASYDAYNYYLRFSYERVYRNNDMRWDAISVRCLRD
jgi:uncharacterized protein (TIGR02145 family)